MAKLGNYRIMGRSGAIYRFEAFPLSTDWEPVAAVFMVTHRHIRPDGSAGHVPLRVGQTANMQQIGDHLGGGKGYRSNCICLLLEKSEAERLKIIDDLGASSAFSDGSSAEPVSKTEGEIRPTDAWKRYGFV